jgi:hypothetical protein
MLMCSTASLNFLAIGAGTVAKTTLLLNTNHGPWLSGEFGRQKSEMLALALDCATPDDPWFMQYYETMCFDRNLPTDTSPGVLFEAMMESKHFLRAGSYVRRLIYTYTILYTVIYIYIYIYMKGVHLVASFIWAPLRRHFGS